MKQIKALESAITAEKSAVDYYKEQSELAEDPETRLLFAQLAKEEEWHYKKLVERLKAVRIT